MKREAHKTEELSEDRAVGTKKRALCSGDNILQEFLTDGEARKGRTKIPS